MKPICYQNWQSWISHYEKHCRHCKRKWFKYEISIYADGKLIKLKELYADSNLKIDPKEIEDIVPLLHDQYVRVKYTEILLDKWSNNVKPIIGRTKVRYRYWKQKDPVIDDLFPKDFDAIFNDIINDLKKQHEVTIE